MKHTPGPWMIYKEAGNNNTICIENEVIAENVNSNNSHLIASAPELLSCLKEALEILEDIQFENDKYNQSTFHRWGKIKQTIYKAEGNI